jgi:Tol biopolymer transport system component
VKEVRAISHLVFLICAVVVCGCAGSVEPPAPAQIVFANDSDGDTEIYFGEHKLTSNDASDYSPRWSPDGKWIVFVSDRDGDEELFVMGVDGSGLRRLTSNRVPDSTPAWSPDGRLIAFASARASDGRELYVMSASGGKARRLVRSARRGQESWSPSWSPDGRRIAFASNRADFLNVEIYSVGSDGTGLRRLTRHAGTGFGFGDDTTPDWSPDGTHIAFVSNRDRQTEVYVMKADGSEQRRVTRTPYVWEQLPRWSRDGSKFLFATSTRVLEMRAAGTHRRQLLGRGWDADWRA